MTRKSTVENVNALKTAFKLLVSDLGGIVAAASCTRVGTSQLSDYGNPASDKMPPIDVVMDLEAIAGVPHVTAEACRQQGGVFRKYILRPHHELIASLQRISKDNGALFSQAVHALGAGHVSPHERQKMVAELLDIERAVHDALLALDETGGLP